MNRLRRRRTVSIVTLGAVAVAGVAVSLFGATTDLRAAMTAYIAAFVFVATTALGALVLLMVVELTGATWFAPLRGPCDAIVSVLPCLVPLFVPIALEASVVYPWAHSTGGLPSMDRDAVEHARRWLTLPTFVARSGLYLVVWISLGEAWRRAAKDRPARPARLRALSAVGLLAIAVSATFAGIDWVMSTVPGWAFDITGLYLLTGAFSSALGIVALSLWLDERHAATPASVDDVHALGKMLFMSVALWAYIAVSQLIIVWSANLPREAPFYLARTASSWRFVAAALALGHFVVPFFVLLPRAAKRKKAWIAALGAWLALMHAVDVHWLLVPIARARPSALDIAPLVAVVSLAIATALFRLPRAPSRADSAADGVVSAEAS